MKPRAEACTQCGLPTKEHACGPECRKCRLPHADLCGACRKERAKSVLAIKAHATEQRRADGIAADEARRAPARAKRAINVEHGDAVLTRRAVSDYFAAAEVLKGRLRRYALAAASCLQSGRAHWPRLSAYDLIRRAVVTPDLVYHPRRVVTYRVGRFMRHAVLEQRMRQPPGPRAADGQCCPCGHLWLKHGTRCNAKRGPQGGARCKCTRAASSRNARA